MHVLNRVLTESCSHRFHVCMYMYKIRVCIVHYSYVHVRVAGIDSSHSSQDGPSTYIKSFETPER